MTIPDNDPFDYFDIGTPEDEPAPHLLADLEGFIAYARTAAPDASADNEARQKVNHRWSDLLKRHAGRWHDLADCDDADLVLERLANSHYGGKGKAKALRSKLAEHRRQRKAEAKARAAEEAEAEERARLEQLGEAIEAGTIPAWQHLEQNDKGVPHSDLNNVLAVLEHDPRWSERLRHSGFALRNEIATGTNETDDPSTWTVAGEKTWREIGKNVPAFLRAFCGEVYGMRRVTGRDAGSAIDIACSRRYVDPLTDYLDHVATTVAEPLNPDGFLAEFVDANGASAEQLATYSRVFLLSAVARAYQPGIKVDDVLVLLGDQGVGKSTMLRSLVPDERWMTDAPPTLSKILGHQSTMGSWLYELSELDASLTGRTAAAFKAWISREADTYENKGFDGFQRSLRRCVFVGTTNVETFNPDATGNRRYMPVTVHGVDNEGIRACRDRIWAGAVLAYRRAVERLRKGDNAPAWYLTADERRAYQASVDGIDIEHPWIALLDAMITDTGGPRPRVAGGYHLGDLMRHLGIGGHARGHEAQELASQMKRAGWEKRKMRADGRRSWLWFPPSEEG